MSENLECGNCGMKLPLSYPESCPKCGSIITKLTIIGEGGLTVGGNGRITFIKKYPKIKKFLIFLFILLSLAQLFIGLLIKSPFHKQPIGFITGIIINILISVIASFLGYKAIIYIIEKENYN